MAFWKSWLKRVLPERVYDALRILRGRVSLYEVLYERHAVRFQGDAAAVGQGPFELIGQLELAVLRMAGLQPKDTLVDFGCGSGRLAIWAVPWLVGGGYIGIDISDSLLREASQLIATRVPAPPSRVSWVHQPATRFELEDGTADVVCAFSVFTHMEHEDTYLYLKDALRVVKPGGRFILSCLTMDLEWVREIFLGSAAADLRTRWARVRNVTTSRDLMEALALMAGWTPVRWYAGDERVIPLPDSQELAQFGQSICVLERRGP